MKKFSFSLITAAIAALSFTGCAVEENLEPKDQNVSIDNAITVNFVTKTVDTKTAFGEFDETANSYPAVWTSSDNVIGMSLNMAKPVEALVNKETEVSNNAKFTATFEDSGAPYQFYALSPVSSVNTVSESRSSWNVTIPTVQTPKADGLSCDEAAMVIYSKSEAMNAIPSEPVELHFSHVTTYCRLVLKNIESAFQSNGVTDATVKSVDVTYSTPVAGNWYVDLTDGSIKEREASHTISIKPTLTDLSQPTDIWYAMAPVTLDGETVKVTVHSDKGNLTREYTFGTRTYAPGAVNKLTLDLTKNTTFSETKTELTETVYQLVTSANELSVNDEVIFVDAVTPTYAMTSTANGTNGIKSTAEGFTFSATDKYIRLSDNTTVITMTVSSKSGSTFTFKNGSNYLTSAIASGTTGNPHYATLETTSKALSVSIAEGVAQVIYKSVSGKTTYSLYNNSDHFTFFTSQGGAVIKTVAIYKKADVTTTIEKDLDSQPVLGKDDFGAYIGSDSYIHTFGVSQLSREYAANTVTFSILNPTENTVLEFSGIPSNAAKGDEFSLNVIQISGRKKTSLGAFNVTVVKEDGSKIWLSDFSGNGFIVKR